MNIYSTRFFYSFFAALHFDCAQACTYELFSVSFVAFIESKSKFAHVRVVWRSFVLLFAQNFSCTNRLSHLRKVGTGSACAKDVVSWFLCPKNEFTPESGRQASAMSCVSACKNVVANHSACCQQELRWSFSCVHCYMAPLVGPVKLFSRKTSVLGVLKCKRWFSAGGRESEMSYDVCIYYPLLTFVGSFGNKRCFFCHL